MSNARRATVITDASFCHTTRAGGYGIWISMDGMARVQKSGVIKGSPANATDAEFKAALIGIWYAYQCGARVILIQTDCMAVVQTIGGSRSAGQAAYRRALEDAKSKHFPDCSLRARHVKGHTTVADARSYVNRWCDHHAGIAMRAERKNRLGAKPSPIPRDAATVRRAPKRPRPDEERGKIAMLKLAETGITS